VVLASKLAKMANESKKMHVKKVIDEKVMGHRVLIDCYYCVQNFLGLLPFWVIFCIFSTVLKSA
jgi:hypothetical protein